MNTKSLSKNSVFYLIYNVLNVLFPFVTGIYVARVLVPDSIGQIAYAQNIVQYFVIFAFLGIPTYGMREVAKCRENKEKLNSLYSELFIINLISTSVFLALYLVLIFSVPRFSENILLYLTVGISIALNALNINWLYEGLEEFSYISIRNIIVKVICFLLLVIFVRDKSDSLLYAFITVFGTAGNYILNIIYSKNFVKLKISGLHFKKHMKPIVYLVLVNLAVEIYTLVDTTMIGNMCSDSNVAFYSYGSRINKILLQVVNSFTMVVVPRLSAIYKEKKFDEFNSLLSKTLTIVFVLAVPMIVGLQFTSSTLINLIYGEAYLPSAKVLNILCLNLLISPIGYLLGSRVMLVSGNEKKMVYCVGIGSIVNIIGNYFLISHFQEVGASIASVFSEIVVMVVYLAFSHKKFKLVNIMSSVLKICGACIIMVLWLIAAIKLFTNSIVFVLVGISVAVCLYFGILLVAKESFAVDVYNKITSKLCRK